MTYVYKTEPYEHQRQAFENSRNVSEWAYFMEMGCGKSKVLIDNAAWLYENRNLNTLVIIAPKGVYRNWVLKEIPIHMPDRIPHKVFTWRSSPRKHEVEELIEACDYSDGLRILVVNTEALITKKFKDYYKKFRNYPEVNMIAVDESTAIKNHKAKRTKSIIALGQDFHYRRILTGSPVTQSPMDLYSQCAFLDSRLLGHENYYSFQARYAITRRQKMGNHSFDMIVGYRHIEELAQKLKEFSTRVLKKDCLDLPEKTYTVRYVSMTDEQRKHYTSFKEIAMTIVDDEVVSATEAMSQLLRLQQVLCGYLPVNDVLTDIANNRIDAMMEAIEEIDGKVIIWARFVEDIRRIESALKKKYGESSTGSYYGGTSDEERERIVEDFQNPESELRFFVGNAQTAGFGLTLTAASNVIYYSNNFNLEHRVQSEDRCHRIGQKNPVTYIDLVVPDSVDEHIVKALRNKINLAGRSLGEQMREWLKV